MYLVLCAAVFLSTYLLNILTVSIGYHRTLAHGALKLRPWAKRLLVAAGSWVTGLDPKAWVVMHRLHHEYSDTPADPHSPVNVGVFGIATEQLRSYKKVLVGLLKQEEPYVRISRDLDFPVSGLNAAKRWYLPYVLHAFVGLGLGIGLGWLLGAAYFVGMMSHPLQGGLVNSLGHALGGRNFETPDNSRNNHLVAWLILGEGFQNNHHRYPASARFSYRRFEWDAGYAACVLLEKAGVLEIQRATLIPEAPAVSLPHAPARS